MILPGQSNFSLKIQRRESEFLASPSCCASDCNRVTSPDSFLRFNNPTIQRITFLSVCSWSNGQGQRAALTRRRSAASLPTLKIVAVGDGSTPNVPGSQPALDSVGPQGKMASF